FRFASRRRDCSRCSGGRRRAMAPLPAFSPPPAGGGGGGGRAGGRRWAGRGASVLRLYGTMAALGLLHHLGVLALPGGLAVLGHPAIIAIAGALYVAGCGG